MRHGQADQGARRRWSPGSSIEIVDGSLAGGRRGLRAHGGVSRRGRARRASAATGWARPQRTRRSSPPRATSPAGSGAARLLRSRRSTRSKRPPRSPFDEGCRRERELFVECVQTEQAKALIHAFFAERAATKLRDVPADVRPEPIERVAIIGAGTMGGGIAMACVNAGIPVTIKDTTQEALDRGLATIRRNYESSVKRGRLTADAGRPAHRRDSRRRSDDDGVGAGRPRHRGGVREHGRSRRQVFRDVGRGRESRMRCSRPTPPRSTSTRLPPRPRVRPASSACISSARRT